MPRFQTLPLDILREVVSHVNTGADVFNLILTSKAIYHNLFIYLYRDIEVRDLERSLKVVHFLLGRPHVARNVLSLVLRPSYLRKHSQKRLAGERDLVNAVELLAPNLYQLKRFIWDGFEAPPSRVWASLRAGCPQLKDIGTNVGNEALDPESELFAFSNLRSFSLTTELHTRNLDWKVRVWTGEELPEALWSMIIDRCPDLESLVLGDGGATMHTKRIIDVRPLLHARWPHLHALSISNARIVDISDVFNDAPREQFVEFIHEHRKTLRYLTYHAFSAASHSRYNDPPLLRYRSCGLPTVMIPATHVGRLREVVLTDKAYCGAHALSRVKRYLGCLWTLRSLSIWVDFSESVQEYSYEFDEDGNMHHRPVWYDQVKELQELYESCPRGLESFKLLVSTRAKETFYWRDIPNILRRRENFRGKIHGVGAIPYFQLKHLEVWKVFKTSDGDLANAAAHIALDEKPQRSGLEWIGSPSSPSSFLSSSSSFAKHTRSILPTTRRTSISTPPLASHNNKTDTPLNLTHPLLESITLVACINQWGACDTSRIRSQPVQIMQHATYRIRRRTVVEPEPRVGAARALARSLRSSVLSLGGTGIDALGPVPSSANAPTTATTLQPQTTTTTTTIITLSANERGGEYFTSLLTKRYDIELSTSPSRGSGGRRTGWMPGNKTFTVDGGSTSRNSRKDPLIMKSTALAPGSGIGSSIGQNSTWTPSRKREWRVQVIKPKGRMRSRLNVGGKWSKVNHLDGAEDESTEGGARNTSKRKSLMSISRFIGGYRDQETAA
ncbi:hypothetical protein GYMLUDRAFT_83848 [Collybiopsis luxurians FD-317 M1]|uniref:Uncharacterized protein n=1 Tax=Collybiopsis luxurians FD-317 M1 TaxID=944289 RepID=A0A0D0C586_9AGAR|nr:hypothetical protein GYMLUDRAFT_83848 [Collybiopsis luxurians FD-317 M1]